MWNFFNLRNFSFLLVRRLWPKLNSLPLFLAPNTTSLAGFKLNLVTCDMSWVKLCVDKMGIYRGCQAQTNLDNGRILQHHFPTDGWNLKLHNSRLRFKYHWDCLQWLPPSTSSVSQDRSYVCGTMRIFWISITVIIRAPMALLSIFKVVVSWSGQFHSSNTCLCPEQAVLQAVLPSLSSPRTTKIRFYFRCRRFFGLT